MRQRLPISDTLRASDNGKSDSELAAHNLVSLCMQRLRTGI